MNGATGAHFGRRDGGRLADQVLAPIRVLAADARPTDIKAIEMFNISRCRRHKRRSRLES